VVTRDGQSWLDDAEHPELGVVVIGRNEARTLKQALESALRVSRRVVYVDSMSTDGSRELARAFPSVYLVELEAVGAPLSAARARNAGMQALRAGGALEYVQFLDGDGVLCDGWVDVGLGYLKAHPEVGIVAGRLREMNRRRNGYHVLADMEWKQPLGVVEASGGIMLVQSACWEAAGGMNPAIAAGEELDFCLRARELGYSTVQLAHDMALHDIDMDAFWQWWERSARAGSATADVAWRRRRKQELWAVGSALFWGCALPGLSLACALPTRGASLALLTAYAPLWLRIRQRRLKWGDGKGDAALYATFCIIGKLSAVHGIASFAQRRLRNLASVQP
jgi:GT2 family glycosyltransferase